MAPVLGAATAGVLLDRGARIIVADINEEAGETLASGKDGALYIIENRMFNGEVIRLDGAIRMQP